jgi:hypothetical protein
MIGLSRISAMTTKTQTTMAVAAKLISNTESFISPSQHQALHQHLGHQGDAMGVDGHAQAGETAGRFSQGAAESHGSCGVWAATLAGRAMHGASLQS